MRRLLNAKIWWVLAALAPQVSAAQQDLGGNWRIEGDGGAGFLSINYPAVHACVATETGACQFEWRFDESGQELNVSMRSGALSEYARVFLIDEVTIVRGNTGPRFEVEFTSIEDGFREGEWVDTFRSGARSGFERWSRLDPEILRIGTTTINYSSSFAGVEWHEAGQTPVVQSSGPYRAQSWAAGNQFPGVRPQFEIYLTGPNLWGFQTLEFVDALGFQITAQNNMVRNPNDPNGLPFGRWFRVVLWQDATPGIKTLRLGDQEFELEIVVDGFPTPSGPEPINTALAFEGLGRADSAIGIALEFEGLGRAANTIDASVAFEGLGRMSDPIEMELSFEGLGGWSDPIAAELSFVGLGRPNEGVAAELSFTGIGRGQDPIDASLALTGLGRDTVAVDAALGFTGLGRDQSAIEASIAFRGLGNIPP